MSKYFETLDKKQSVYIDRTHNCEVGKNDSCYWIHLWGYEGADTKLVFYSEEELNNELPRVQAAIQESKDAVGQWECWNNCGVFHVMRLRDNREPFHGGNYEYANRFYKDEPIEYETRELAQEAAERLNAYEKVNGKAAIK